MDIDKFQKLFKDARAKFNEMNIKGATEDQYKKLKEDIDELVKMGRANPLFGAIVSLIDPLRKKVEEALQQYQTSAPASPPVPGVANKHKNTPFNIFDKDFIEQYSAYLEGVAINASTYTTAQLLQAGQILRDIGEDLSKLSPESDKECAFLQQVEFQTPLLLKIVDNQLKNTAVREREQAPASSPKSAAPAKTVKKSPAKKAVKKSVAKTSPTKAAGKKAALKKTAAPAPGKTGGTHSSKTGKTGKAAKVAKATKAGPAVRKPR